MANGKRYCLAIYKRNDDGLSFHCVSFRVCRTAHETFLRSRRWAEGLQPGERIRIEIDGPDPAETAVTADQGNVSC